MMPKFLTLKGPTAGLNCASTWDRPSNGWLQVGEGGDPHELWPGRQAQGSVVVRED